MSSFFNRRLIHLLARLGCLVFILFCLAAVPVKAGSASGQIGDPGPPTPAAPLVARVYYSGRADLAWLAARLDIWQVQARSGFVVAGLNREQVAALRQAGYRVEIDPRQTAKAAQPVEALPGQTSGIPGFPCYRTVEETYADMAALAAHYPGLAQWTPIGSSWEKASGGQAGYDLYTLTLTNRAIPGPKPAFFLMGAIHARELATAETAARFAETLLRQYGRDPLTTWLLDHSEAHILPVANPDGRKWAERGLLWRKNTDTRAGCRAFPDYGVDLNRNNGFEWGAASPYACDETYQGPRPDSEPENQAIQKALAAVFPVQRGPGLGDPAPAGAAGLFISLHSFGEQVLWPWGWSFNPAPNAAQLATLGRKLAFFNNYLPEQAVELYPTSGTSDDWAYGSLGLASYTIELGTDFFQDCASFESAVYPANLQALEYAFQAARRPYQSPAGPDTLDLAVAPSAVLAGSPLTVTATADATRYASGQAIQPIAAARYSLDAPAWVSGTQASPLAARDGAFDTPVEDLAAQAGSLGLSPGRHTLFAESRDAAGNWGPDQAAWLCVAARPSALSLEASPIQAPLRPGRTVTYTLDLENLGLAGDTFDLSLGPHEWQTTAPAESPPLAPCAQASLAVAVTAPTQAAFGSSDSVTVTLRSRSDPGVSASLHLTTTVTPAAGLVLAPAAAQAAGLPGGTAGYTLSITNTGDFSDTYSIRWSGNIWPVVAPPLTGPLQRGASEALRVQVAIPAQAALFDQDTVTVTLASQTDPKVLVKAVLTTLAGWRTYFPWVH